jgi:hypothetical protein
VGAEGTRTAGRGEVGAVGAAPTGERGENGAGGEQEGERRQRGGDKRERWQGARGRVAPMGEKAEEGAAQQFDVDKWVLKAPRQQNRPQNHHPKG